MCKNHTAYNSFDLDADKDYKRLAKVNAIYWEINQYRSILHSKNKFSSSPKHYLPPQTQ